MGLLDQLTEMAGGDTGAITQKVEGLLDSVGGVDGLLQKFDAQGMGDQAKSWISPGENQAVSADEVKQALGPEELEKVAQETGTTADGAAEKLSATLPDLVDKLTPDGEIPGPDAIKSQLGKLLG